MESSENKEGNQGCFSNTIFMMMRKKIQIILIPFLFFLLSGCLSRPKPQTGDFSGKVVDAFTQESVPGVTMQIAGLTITSDESGKFSIASLPPGDYQLVLERDWYNQTTHAVHHIEKQNSLKYYIVPLPIEGKLLYSSNTTGNWEICELDLSKRGVIQLTNSNSSEVNPVKYSEEQILIQSTFQSHDRYNYDLFFFNRSLQEFKLIYASAKNDQHPSSKISGDTMIFQSDGEKIYSYSFFDNTARKIIEKGQNPVVGPDGAQIAYVDTNNHLCVANIDGTNIRTINHSGKVNNPCWCPTDRNKIAVELWEESEGSRYIYIMNADGTGTPQRVTWGRFKSDQHKHPCWSKDGSIIYFSGNILYSSRYDIYGIRVSDGIQEKMSWIMVSGGTGDKEDPSWNF